MKIGILTHHYVSNYGAFLQSYCLREAIARLFPDDDVRIIDYINLRHRIINTGGCLRFYYGRETVASWLEKIRLPGVFRKARKDSLRLTKRVYTVAGINALGLDTIVVGSDEVWNYRDMRSYAAMKFGCGLSEGIRLVSYAASVGNIKEYDDLPPCAKAGLQRFSALSVRDDDTDAFLRAVVHQTATRVLDPVFLSQTPDGYTPRIASLTRQPYILFYHCAPLSEQKQREIAAYAKQQGVRLLGAGEYSVLYDQRSIDLRPFEWVELFRRARYVVTGTFHGAVFSIVNKRPFSACPNNPTRVAKLGSLLKELGLEGRMGTSAELDLSKMEADVIDYQAVEAKLRERIRHSEEYLKTALRP